MTDKNLPQAIKPEWIEEFDKIVMDCAAATSAVVKSLTHDMTVLNGIQRLKKFFAQPPVSELVLSAAGNDAGFLCDKTNYSYEELVQALIPRILEGYRITGNEINIISGKGMPVKRGKYRRIIELTDGFRETVGAPVIKDGFALIRCAAKWKIGDIEQTLGVEEDDPCIIKIKYNAAKYDTIDKANGLAQSKLYSRVLTRILGQFVPEEAAPVMKDISEQTQELKPETKKPSAPPKKATPPRREQAQSTEPSPPPTDVIPEIVQLQEMLGSDEHKSVIFRLDEEKTLTDKMLIDAQKAKTGEKAQAIIDLIEASK
jgi:hypothetical protein